MALVDDKQWVLKVIGSAADSAYMVGLPHPEGQCWSEKDRSFHRPAHAADEIALKEQENQNYRHYGNQNSCGKLVVLCGKLGAELHKSAG
jgi:hypothetical protein